MKTDRGKKEFRIIFTSDIHGRLFASDRETGLDAMSRLFHKDGNTLIFDGGDLLQGGTAGAFLARRVRRGLPVRREDGGSVRGWKEHPAAIVLNEGGYDAVTLGNHDFNYGIPYLGRYLNSLAGYCLCANIRDRAGRLPIKGSHIFVLENGLRIGVFGLCTDALTGWEREETLRELSVELPLKAAHRVLPGLSGRCDLTVCLYHGGYEENSAGEIWDESGENIACRLCRECGIDVLLTGHQHRREPGKELDGTYTLQPGCFAGCYAELTGAFVGGHLSGISSRFVEAPALGEEPAFGKISALGETPVFGETPVGNEMFVLEEVRGELRRWEEQLLCRLPMPIPIEDRIRMALFGSPLADFINQIQMAVTGAQISATCLSNTAAGLPAEVRIRDVFRTYTSANTLCTVLCDGATLRRGLEWTAAFLNKEEGEYRIDRRFLEPKPRFFHYDFYAGIDYRIDFSLPVGRRIVYLQYKGRDIRPEDSFTLCLTNYRRAGGDGYEMFRSCKLLRADPIPVVEHMIALMGNAAIRGIYPYKIPIPNRQMLE